MISTNAQTLMRTYLLAVLIVILFSHCTRDSNNAIKQVSQDSVYNYTYEGRTYQLVAVNNDKYKKVKLMDVYQDISKELCDTTEIVIQGNDINLLLKNGDTLTLRNDTVESDAMVRYDLSNILKHKNFWFIEGHFYEWSEFELINKNNGRRMEIWGYPFLSPNQQYFVCADNKEADGPTSYRLQVFEIVGVGNIKKCWK